MCAETMRRYGHISTSSMRIFPHHHYTIKPDFVNIFCVKKIAREAVFTVF